VRLPRKYYLLPFLLTLVSGACSKESDVADHNPDWARGRAVYVANCVACHNNDPSKDGPIGPALKGSPRELLESRVLRTEYPAGYKPKRSTKVMPTFPFLKTEIPYLAAYLNGTSHQNKEQQVENRGQDKPKP
jgi:mono/diheme cytochrome c family protein